jgi:hypothetical protein
MRYTPATRRLRMDVTHSSTNRIVPRDGLQRKGSVCSPASARNVAGVHASRKLVFVQPGHKVLRYF